MSRVDYVVGMDVGCTCGKIYVFATNRTMTVFAVCVFFARYWDVPLLHSHLLNIITLLRLTFFQIIKVGRRNICVCNKSSITFIAFTVETKDALQISSDH